jgi:hypothetical protein
LSEFFCVAFLVIAAILHQNEQEQCLQLFSIEAFQFKRRTNMKHKPLSFLLVLLLLSSYTTLAFAQASSNDWAVVQQIRTSEDLIVKKRDGRQVKGEMIEATDTTLTIDDDGKPVSIPRAEVRQIQVIERKAKKGKWAWIGTGIGAGAGAAIGAVKYSENVDDSQLWIPVGLMFGAGIGAATGFLVGANRRKRTMIYDAR